MINFDEIIECQNIIDSLINDIISSKNKHVIFIFGTYKQGKTYTLEALFKRLKAEIFFFNTFFIKSIKELSLSGIDYYPILSFIDQNTNTTFKTFHKYAEVIFGSHTFTKIIRDLLQIENIYPQIYTKEEIGILEDIRRMAKNRKSIFLIDDVDCWDEASFTLLSKLLNERIVEWMQDNTLIISSTKKSTIKKLNLESDKYKTYELKSLTLSDISKYLSQIDSKLNAADLYEITDGNIGQVLEAVSLLHDSSTKISSNVQFNILSKIQSTIESQANIGKIDLNNDVDNTMELINSSSIIGADFTRQLLREVSLLDNGFDKCLNYALYSEIYSQYKNCIRFKFASVQDQLKRLNCNNIVYHTRLAKAIQKIMPSNFYLRAQELLLSNNRYEASIAYCNHAINYIRKYQKPVIHDKLFENMLFEDDLLAPLNNIEQAYLLYYQYDYRTAVNKLCFTCLPGSLEFQNDYLKALILINGSVLSSDYRDAQLLLKKWIDNIAFKNSEPYLWLQSAILYDAISRETGSEIFTNDLINGIFTKYCETDHNFEIEYHNFLSVNNYTYSIDIQYKNSKQAFMFFKQDASTSKTFLARAMVNYSGNAITMGEYEEAIELFNNFIELQNQYAVMKNFSCSMLNNVLIAYFLNDVNKAHRNALLIISYFEYMLDESKNDIISTTLLKINLGSILFFANRIQDALELYNELYMHFCLTENIDPYYAYFILNNYFILTNYNLRRADLSFIDKLDELKPYPSNDNFFKTRNRILRKKIFELTKDEQLITPMENTLVGPAWKFWGLPILFTDMQYWSY